MKELFKELEWFIAEAGIEEHSINVERYCLLIYDNLNNKPDYADKDFSSREVVGLCGRYHDIGKYFFNKVYPLLLDKDRFCSSDKEMIKQHTLMGQLLLQIVSGKLRQTGSDILYKALMDAIAYHHERTDGTGYYKRRGDAIPFIAQLVAVADHYSAGTEDRVYGKKKSSNKVLSELTQDVGLNEECVNALAKGLAKGP